MAEKLDIFLLSEDTSKHARPALEHLTRKLVRLLAPEMAEPHVGFKRRPTEAEGRAAAADNWTGRKEEGHNSRVELIHAIAAHVLRPDGYVFFHYDAEKTWPERDGSFKRKAFQKKLRHGIGIGVRGSKLVLKRWPNGIPQNELDTILSRVIELVPTHSIEAWYYQASTVAKDICLRKYQGLDLQLFEDWEKDRASLEAVESPKKLTRLGNKHNVALAKAFPATTVYGLELSFHEAVERARACESLVAAVAGPDPGP